VQPATRLIVRTCAGREHFAAQLRALLPDAEWCHDTKRNAMQTYLAALAMAGNDPVVIMEDDILLTRNFRAKLESAIAEHPINVIQFFSMRKADLTAGSRWDRNFMMNQCVYLPPFLAAELLAWAKALHDITVRWQGTDSLLRDFLYSRKEKHWIHVPSLVNHAIAVSQIDKRRSSKRQSFTFADPEPIRVSNGGRW